MSSSYRSSRLGLSHWDPYAVRRGGCLELYYFNMVEWSWWDWSLIWKLTGFLLCFDTVGLVIWPVKIVPEMTYNVLSGTLSLYTTTGWPDLACSFPYMHTTWRTWKRLVLVCLVLWHCKSVFSHTNLIWEFNIGKCSSQVKQKGFFRIAVNEMGKNFDILLTTYRSTLWGKKNCTV